MTRLKLHRERHVIGRLGWLRAAVLGANDGVLSTSSLIIGVASAHGTAHAILIAGVSGMVAGAMSMAAGEYVSVSSQQDTETADIERERGELATDVDGEIEELAGIYMARGLDRETAGIVARQLMAHDALGAHARDELGISAFTTARPVQAALTSAATFSVGAALPLATVLVAPSDSLPLIVTFASLAFLALLGAIGATAGGASLWRASVRVTVWGALAMAATAGIGKALGTVI